MWIFETLSRQSRNVLEQLLSAGAPVKVDDVTGWEFRGWNVNPLTTVIRTRKFKKGFYRDRKYRKPWGYNVRVRQGSIYDPWIALPNEENPDRFYFFGISDPAPSNRYPNALVVDYRRWPKNWIIDPVRYTVDYLTAPEPLNPNLLVGKSYLELPLVSLFLGFFVLERHNPTDYGGPLEASDER